MAYFLPKSIGTYLLSEMDTKKWTLRNGHWQQKLLIAKMMVNDS